MTLIDFPVCEHIKTMNKKWIGDYLFFFFIGKKDWDYL